MINIVSAPRTILFFGPSGSGKGTQVKLLVEKLQKDGRKLINIEMGALLRSLVAGNTYSGNLTAEIINHGILMPGFMPVYLATKHLVDNFTGEEHIIADGVVRRPDQATGWDDAMQFYNRADYDILVMNLSDNSIMERLLARGRNDDTREAISKRIGWYHEEVEPLLKILKARGRKIHEINAELGIEQIHLNILNSLQIK